MKKVVIIAVFSAFAMWTSASCVFAGNSELRLDALVKTGKAVVCTYENEPYQVVGVTKIPSVHTKILGSLGSLGSLGPSSHSTFVHIRKGNSPFFSVQLEDVKDVELASPGAKKK